MARKARGRGPAWPEEGFSTMSRLPRQLEDLARMLSYMLGLQPDEFGLVLDEEGWIPARQLLQALSEEPGFAYVRREHLERLAVLLSPPRFELAGDRLRALTSPPPLRRPLPGPPPPLLYLGIVPKVHSLVWEQGVKPPVGQEVVLAATPELARRLGRRRAPEPVLITVQAQAAARKGVTFQAYGEELYLTKALPREFLQMPAPPRELSRAKPAKPAQPPLPDAAGSLILDLPQMLQETFKGRDKKGEPAWKAGARSLRRKRREK